MPLRHHSLRALLVALLVGAASVAALPGTAARAAEPVCDAMTTPIRQLVNPGVSSNLLTPWATEASTAISSFGFTEDLGSPFEAAVVPAQGLGAVHRFYNPESRDFAWALSASDQNELKADGYVDQGANFYASPVAVQGCAVPVIAMVKGGYHRYTLTSGRAALQAAGWSGQGAAFYAVATTGSPEPPPNPGDTVFSFAVMPDTQDEAYGDQRMPKRVSWLIDNEARRDLRWVMHSGDLHSWDTPDHYQYVNHSRSLTPLSTAGIPFMSAVGNHDTNAVCPGGSACPGANTNLELRNTTTWNAYYPPNRFGYEGVYQSGKSDNGYRTFQAGGVSWMVLTIELWPRTEVINWARGVVASHPRHNVILQTHSFLEADGSLSGSNGGYGANSPATLWSGLDEYPNVVMAFSGHVGASATNLLAGTDGHRMAAFLQAFHDPSKNPTRIVTIDTAAGTISTEVRANYDKALPAGQQDIDYVYPYTTTVSGMRWVR